MTPYKENYRKLCRKRIKKCELFDYFLVNNNYFYQHIRI